MFELMMYLPVTFLHYKALRAVLDSLSNQSY